MNSKAAESGQLHDDAAGRHARLRYPRDPSLDPQLVWTGKDQQDGEDLVVDAPPIFVQETILPRALIENLRRTACQPGPGLFDDSDDSDGSHGPAGWAAVEYYPHDGNWSNRMILGDSLHVMASLAEQENLRGQVQMIYIDPPYGIRFGSNWQTTTGRRDVADGKADSATREVEQIKAYRDTWELGIHSYLAYLRDRLTVAHDLLTESGSVFVQIGAENVHLVRCLLDEVFGSENFVSLISYVTTGGFESNALARAGDHLLWYAKTASRKKVRRVWLANDKAATSGYRWIMLPDGTCRGLSGAELAGIAPLPHGARLYTPDNLQSQNPAGADQAFEYRHKVYRPGANSHWKASCPDGMNRLAWANRIHVARNSIRYVRYADDFGYRQATSMWTDTGTGNFTDDKIYVVQTNSKVVERCLHLTTDPGDLVLDPTCGSATTAVAAEKWGRRWVTIDTSRVALALARQRIMTAQFPYYLLADSRAGQLREAALTGRAAADGTSGDVRKGFVCERVPHIKIESIAGNPDLRPGMSGTQIDQAIARHAQTELLLDRPYQDSTTIRVAGRFTVESLSPHRTISPARPATEQDSRAGDASVFERTILDNLLTAGVQNGRKQERLEFEALSPYPGSYIQADGTRRNGKAGTPKRIAVSIGPQFGTVDPEWIRKAAREAARGRGFDLLLVCAFAFDPQAVKAAEEFGPGEQGGFGSAQHERAQHERAQHERLPGRLPILLVRINSDLAMGDVLLRKTGSANLFTVFGEPDVAIERTPAGVVVEIRGVDVYNPATGQIRSSGTGEIALWMIDTDYDGESFFVRHCYFTGGGDPYARLKRALRADIDQAAWESLYATRSRPFDPPRTGQIAVKVINHYGDEVLQVYAA